MYLTSLHSPRHFFCWRTVFFVPLSFHYFASFLFFYFIFNLRLAVVAAVAADCCAEGDGVDECFIKLGNNDYYYCVAYVCLLLNFINS